MKEAVESLLSLGLIRKSADICEANVMTKSRRDFGITAPLCGLLSFSTIHSVVSLVLGSLFKTSYCLVTSFDVTPRMSWYYLLKDFILINSICSFQGTYWYKWWIFIPSGDGEIRTLDPLLARQVLSQLSYTPTNPGTHLLSHAVSSIVPSAA